MDKCDMCGEKIVDCKCSFGIWKSAEKIEEHPFKRALEYFHQSKQLTMTGDMPRLGYAIVLFHGDYNDCKKVEKFIHTMKGRPYYDD